METTTNLFPPETTLPDNVSKPVNKKYKTPGIYEDKRNGKFIVNYMGHYLGRYKTHRGAARALTNYKNSLLLKPMASPLSINDSYQKMARDAFVAKAIAAIVLVMLILLISMKGLYS